MPRPRGERADQGRDRQYSLLAAPKQSEDLLGDGACVRVDEEPGAWNAAASSGRSAGSGTIYSKPLRSRTLRRPEPVRSVSQMAGPAREQASRGRPRYWLALYFPELAFDVLYRGSGEPLGAQPPTVIVSGTQVQTRVMQANAPATRAGIKTGMTASAASALVAGLRIVRRDPDLEQLALEGLASWAGQFSSVVCLRGAHRGELRRDLHGDLRRDRGLLIETGGSRRLFGGLGLLLAQALDELQGLGYRAMSGAAPTPAAAWLLARGGEPDPVEQASSLPARLGPLPVRLLDVDEPTLEALHGMGLHRFADCCRMPRDGFARRFGPELLAQLDRALGRRPEALVPYQPPPSFARRLNLSEEIHETSRLLYAIKPLLLELTGFLRARSGGVRGLEVHLAHRGSPATRLTINLVGASRDGEHLLGLIGERLERLILPSPVVYLAVKAQGIERLEHRSGDLYPARRPEHDAWCSLVERLGARLGNESVCGIVSASDHRPEYAWRIAGPEQTGAAPDSTSRPLRPVWLLAQPVLLTTMAHRPYHGGRLELCEGPERIQSGWWDEADVARDYYLAESPSGSRYWVYQECRGDRQWYLHGLFA